MSSCPPLLCIHGFGGAAGIWQWQREYFLPSRRIICIDLPGHGGKPWQPTSLEGMAAQVDEAVRDVAADSVDVLASSFGGLVALKFWEQNPKRVRRLVFAGSLPRFTAEEGFPAGLNTARIRKLALQLSGDVPTVMEMFFRSVVTLQERSDKNYESIRLLRKTFPVPERDALLAILDLLETSDLREVLCRVNKSVLFLLGDKDPLCPPGVIPSLQQSCSGVYVEVIKEAGHFPFLTQPADFNIRVERFLA